MSSYYNNYDVEELWVRVMKKVGMIVGGLAFLFLGIPFIVWSLWSLVRVNVFLFIMVALAYLAIALTIIVAREYLNEDNIT